MEHDKYMNNKIFYFMTNMVWLKLQQNDIYVSFFMFFLLIRFFTYMVHLQTEMLLGFIYISLLLLLLKHSSNNSFSK